MSNTDSPQELITLAEAAKRYGFVHAYLRNLVLRGRLSAKKLGRDWVTTPADMEAYIAGRQKRGVYRDDIHR